MLKITSITIAIFFSLFLFEPVEINFGKGKDGKDWRVVNDGVMGGLSKGKAQLKENSLFFSGTISLENNGGFTSFRAPYQRSNLSGLKIIEVRYRSTGRSCAISLDQDTRFWLPNHKLPLPLSNDWSVVTIPIKELYEYRMGRKTGRFMTNEKAASVIRIGIITDSKEAGDFTFEIDYIKFS